MGWVCDYSVDDVCMVRCVCVLCIYVVCIAGLASVGVVHMMWRWCGGALFCCTYRNYTGVEYGGSGMLLRLHDDVCYTGGVGGYSMLRGHGF